MASKTTSQGTTVSDKYILGHRFVVLANPDAPDGLKEVEAGRIVGGGFQPVPECEFTMSAEVMRAIADLVDNAVQEVSS